MAAYQSFHAKAGPAIRAGDALLPAATGVRASQAAPTRRRLPTARSPRPRKSPAATTCSKPKTSTTHWHWPATFPPRRTARSRFGRSSTPSTPSGRRSDAQWLALLLEPPAAVNTPGTPEWEAEAARHGEFAAAAGDHIVGGAALHEPATATTVRVRDGQALFTDGPFAESAEIATGVYLLSAADRDEAVKLASMIPASAVEVRQLAGVSGL